MMDGHLREYAQAELGMEYHPKAQTAAEKFNRLVRATAKEQRLNEGDAVHVVLMSDPGKALFAVRREDLLDESRAGQQGKLVRRP
jgi:hypothetical protein